MLSDVIVPEVAAWVDKNTKINVSNRGYAAMKMLKCVAGGADGGHSSSDGRWRGLDAGHRTPGHSQRTSGGQGMADSHPKKKNTPSSLHAKTPTAQEPISPPNSPGGKSEIGDGGDKVREEADAGKASSPLRSARKQVSKVSEADQMEHVLVGGQWEGLGAVRKGREIRIEVHPRPNRIENERD